MPVAGRRILALVLVISLAAATAGSSAIPNVAQPTVSCGPLKPLPERWTCIPRFGTDAWFGSYHDSRSGAFVRFQTGGDWQRHFKAKKFAQPSDRSLSGTLGGVRYRSLIFERAREREIENLRRSLGVDYPASSTLLERRLPPEGASGHGATFYKKGRYPINFLGFACTAEQENRVRDLLLGEFRLGHKLIGEPRESQRVSAEWLTRLPWTTTLQDVIATAGVPEGAYPRGCEGLMLVYDVDGTSDEAWLVFDREQRFVTYELHPPGNS